MSILDLFKQVAEAAPENLRTRSGQLSIEPGEGVIEFTSKVDKMEFKAGLIVPSLVLAEAYAFQQLKKDSVDDWMTVMELTAFAPGAKLVLFDDETETYVEAPFYEALPVFAQQTPAFYGQHMRCPADEVERFGAFLREQAGFTAFEIGQQAGGGAIKRSDRRRSLWRLAAPARSKNFATAVGERVKTGVPLRKLILEAQTDPEYPGFTDPASAMLDNFRQALEDGARDDRRRIATQLVSSLTGVKSWENAEHNWFRAPIRATVPELETEVVLGKDGEMVRDSELFSFWSERKVTAAAS